MNERIAIISHNIDDAQLVVDTLRAQNLEDEDIYVITRDDIIMEDLPEADPRQYSDLLPALKRGAGVGGTLGIVGGILMATVPPAGIAVGGGAIAAMAASGAAFGAWASSLVGISVPNSQLEKFQKAVDDGKTLVLVDVEEEKSEALLTDLRSRCEAEIVRAESVDAA